MIVKSNLISGFSLFLITALSPALLCAQKINKGFGSRPIHMNQEGPCVEETEHEDISKMLQGKADSLRLQNPWIDKWLNEKSDDKLYWPLRWLGNPPAKSYWGISNYFDVSPNNSIRDFSCLDRTYNNHQGVDFFLWPAWWRSMDDEIVDVVSAQKGVILAKMDGQFDRQCVWTNATWNAVYVLHPNNQIAWYGHLKRNSLTNKAIGDSVSVGEYLGKVGSSGRSTGPHLHFEVTVNNTKRDPFTGTCQFLSSLWHQQIPYWNPVIVLSQTQSTKPLFPDCPQAEVFFQKDHFNPGDSVFLCNYYRDLRTGDTTLIHLFDPGGEVVDTIVQVETDMDMPYYTAAYNFWWYVFEPSLRQGRYLFRSVFKRDTTYATFLYGDSTVTQVNRKNIEEFRIVDKYIERINNFSTVNLKVYSIDGRIIENKVWEKEQNRIEITLNDSKLYILTLDDNKKIFLKMLFRRMN